MYTCFLYDSPPAREVSPRPVRRCGAGREDGRNGGNSYDTPFRKTSNVDVCSVSGYTVRNPFGIGRSNGSPSVYQPSPVTTQVPVSHPGLRRAATMTKVTSGRPAQSPV